MGSTEITPIVGNPDVPPVNKKRLPNFFCSTRFQTPSQSTIVSMSSGHDKVLPTSKSRRWTSLLPNIAISNRKMMPHTLHPFVLLGDRGFFFLSKTKSPPHEKPLNPCAIFLQLGKEAPISRMSPAGITSKGSRTRRDPTQYATAAASKILQTPFVKS